MAFNEDPKPVVDNGQASKQGNCAPPSPTDQNGPSPTGSVQNGGHQSAQKSGSMKTADFRQSILGNDLNSSKSPYFSDIKDSPNSRQHVTFDGGSIDVSIINAASQLKRSVSVSNMRHSTPVQQDNNAMKRQQNLPMHREQLGIKDPSRPATPALEFQPPDPVYFEDEETGTYGVRCVCGRSHHDGLLIQCDKCQFWLHAICVCIARESKDEPFYCPFCRCRAIRCKCGNNRKYEIPIVQCAQCKFWVHKQCEDLKFGVIPTTFICSKCGENEFTLPLIKPIFDSTNKVSFVDCDRYEVIQSIPEGQFRNFVIADLNRNELHLHETIGRYFQAFAIPLFQKTHEFWKVFVDSMKSLLNCERSDILLTVDKYATTFLYSNKIVTHKFSKPVKFSISESILPIVEQIKLTAVDDEKPKKLYKSPNGNVFISEACEDDGFICELPGFLVHTDEVYADEGIPLTCIRLYNSDLIIDMDGSSFPFAPFISRSFHFNCYAKLYQSNDGPRVGLFATRMKGPLHDQRRGTPVTADTQLFLPLDGEIPYNIPKCDWKAPRSKSKVKNVSRSKVSQKKLDLHLPDSNVNLSLLSAFCEDVVPPIPITLVNEREVSSRSHVSSMVRSRVRSSRGRNSED